MSYPVEDLLESRKGIVQILLMLAVLFTQESKIEDLFCVASSSCEPGLSFNSYLFGLGFKKSR